MSHKYFLSLSLVPLSALDPTPASMQLMILIQEQSNLIKSLQKIIEGLNAKLERSERFENSVSKDVGKDVDKDAGNDVGKDVIKKPELKNFLENVNRGPGKSFNKFTHEKKNAISEQG